MISAGKLTTPRGAQRKLSSCADKIVNKMSTPC